MRFAIVDPFLTRDQEKALLLKTSCKTFPRVDGADSVTTAVWATATWGTPVFVNGNTAVWGSGHVRPLPARRERPCASAIANASRS